MWGRAPEYIRTSNGSLLLASGCWGIARHLNYLGDWMMGLAWCLPVGFARPVPWFYLVYFTDPAASIASDAINDMCRSKYGAAWETYCRKVPWRIIPAHLLTPRERALDTCCRSSARTARGKERVVWCTMILSQYVIARHITGRAFSDDERRGIIRHNEVTRTIRADGDTTRKRCAGSRLPSPTWL